MLGGDDQAAHLALILARLGCDVIVCSDGPVTASDPARQALAARSIRVCAGLVAKVEGVPGLFTDFYTTGEPDSEPVADIPATPAGQPVTSAEQTTARE